MRDEDGCDVVRHYSDLAAAEMGYRHFLRYGHGLIMEGLFDEQGNRIKTTFELDYEKREAERKVAKANEAKVAQKRVQESGCALVPLWISIGLLSVPWFGGS